jgi:hypothetical protein
MNGRKCKLTFLINMYRSSGSSGARPDQSQRQPLGPSEGIVVCVVAQQLDSSIETALPYMSLRQLGFSFETAFPCIFATSGRFVHTVGSKDAEDLVSCVLLVYCIETISRVDSYQ